MIDVETYNFAKMALSAGGNIYPLIIPVEFTNGTGLMNPSVAKIGGEYRAILRHVNYTLYHSEGKLFQHPWGPLSYVHPENDVKLRTWNYYLFLSDDLEVERIDPIDTSFFDNYQPLWEFVGLEDARLVEWDGKIYGCGVRRDTTTNGTGRMEMSEIFVGPAQHATEASRFRIPTPVEDSYCEKNWMPIEDMPYHFVKWSNPAEVVRVCPINRTCETVVQKEEYIQTGLDLRGGSQVIPWDNGTRIAVTHEVIFGYNEVGRKDAIYLHRFVVWDGDWNIIKMSKPFSFMDGHIEFAAGMCTYDDDNVLISYGFQDNAAYILKCPREVINDFMGDV